MRWWKVDVLNRAFAIIVRTFFALAIAYITIWNSFTDTMSTTNSTTPANTPAANSTTPATQPQAPNPAADARARLLEAIEEASFEPATQETHNTHAQVRHQRDAWWNHIVTTFFLGDEARMFRELRISSVVFEEIVNAVADLPLQRRGRRSFIFTHQERVLFLHVFHIHVQTRPPQHQQFKTLNCHEFSFLTV